MKESNEINQKYSGKFWLPEKIEVTIDGELFINESNDYILKLFDYFNDTNPVNVLFRDMDTGKEFQLIIGELDNGQCVVLINSTIIGISLGNNGTYTFSPNYVMFTDKDIIETYEELSFNRVSFRIPYIEKYIGSIKIEHDYNTDCVNLKAISNLEEFDINEEIKLIIHYGYKFQVQNYEKSSLEPYTYIELHLRKELHLQEIYNNILMCFRDFFSMICGTLLCPIDVKLNSVLDKEEKYLSYKCIYKYYRGEIASDRSNKYNHFDDVRCKLKDIMNEFINLYKSDKLVIDNYMTIYLSRPALEFQFLITMYSIEVFSRYLYDEHYYCDDMSTYEKDFVTPITTYLNNNISNVKFDDVKNKLIENLRFCNQKSLRAVLMNILIKYKSVFERLFQFEDKQLCNQLVNNRNWYTHFDLSCKDKAVKGMELYSLLVKARCIYEVCLYKELKIDDNSIISIIKSTYLSL